MREPTITPLIKYFWKNGYVKMMGRVVKMIMEYFNCVAENICSMASSISVELSLVKSTDHLDENAL